MDPHEDLFSPPPAYSEQEFDRKIAQAAQLSEQTAKWEKPRLDVDEDGWPLYDPSLFEERPKPSTKGMYKPEPPAAATSSNVEATPTASSSRQSQDGRDSSPRLAKIVPLRIAKKTKAQEAAEDVEPLRFQSFASGSSMRSDASPTASAHDHDRGPSNPWVHPAVEHQHFVPPYVPTYAPPQPTPANVESAASNELQQAPQSLPHQTPLVPAYSLESAEPHDIAPQSQNIVPHRHSPHDTPLVPTYSLEAPEVHSLGTGSAHLESQVHGGALFSGRSDTHDTPAVPTYTLEASDGHRTSVLINPHDLQQEALQRTPIAPSNSLETSHSIGELTSSFNQAMSMSRQSPSPTPQQSNVQAQSHLSHPLQGHAANPYSVDAQTPTPQTLVLQPANPALAYSNIPQGGFPSQFEPERSWTPSLEPLDLPTSNGYAQNNNYNPYMGPSYSQSLTQVPTSPQTPRYSLPPPQPQTLPRMTIPQRPHSSQPTTYNQPQPVPRLNFNPHSAYSGIAPAARFLGPQKPSSAAPFDAGSFYNSAISSQLKSTPIKTPSYSSYQQPPPQPAQQPQSYNTMASPTPPMNLSRQSVHWQSPARPVSVYSTMTNPNPAPYDTNPSLSINQYTNQYPQYSTNTMQPVPENNRYTHR